MNQIQVQELSDDFELIQIDTDVQEILENIGYDPQSYKYLFVKYGNADYDQIYGCVGIPYLQTYLTELYNNGEQKNE